MSSEEFEKLQEIYRALYDELKLMPESAPRGSGGKLLYESLLAQNNARRVGALMDVCAFPEERKRMVRAFDERQGEAEEVVRRFLSNPRWSLKSYKKSPVD